MKCSLGISNFLEEISNLSHSFVFLYFFVLISEEGFLISPCYSLGLCIQILLLFKENQTYQVNAFFYIGRYKILSSLKLILWYALSRASIQFFSLLNISGFTTESGCIDWWLDGLTLLCLPKWQVTFSVYNSTFPTWRFSKNQFGVTSKNTPTL